MEHQAEQLQEVAASAVDWAELRRQADILRAAVENKERARLMRLSDKALLGECQTRQRFVKPIDGAILLVLCTVLKNHMRSKAEQKLVRAERNRRGWHRL